MRDLWQMPLVQGKERIRGDNGKALHPTQKPEEMLKRIILASSNEGDIVLDPFSCIAFIPSNDVVNFVT
jgi:site-specific DNA-methyltransferase (adenine-specific)/modification methylase